MASDPLGVTDTTSPAARMMAVFDGSPVSCATANFQLLVVEPSGKRVPKYATHRRAATLKDFEKHLAGKMGLLVVPVKPDGTCRFGKIDVDNYELDGVQLARDVKERGYPLVVERSKSGGWHLAWYFKPARRAADVIALLRQWATALGFPDAEIFPKQEALEPGAAGNGINLPYFGGDEAENYAISYDGDGGMRMTLAAWLNVAETTPEWQGAAQDQAAEDREDKEEQYIPPDTVLEKNRNKECARYAGWLISQGVTGEAGFAALRNFNLACCKPPLEVRELRGIWRSVNKGDQRRHKGRHRSVRVDIRPGELPEAVDATIAALAASAAELQLYVNAGRLVRPSVIERDGFSGPDGKPQPVQCLELCPVSLANFRVDLTRIIAFTVTRNVGHGHVKASVIDCPKDVAGAVFEAGEQLQTLPQIERIAEVPVFDGTQLHAAPGLHGRTWVNAPAGITLPAELSRDAAVAALQRLAAVVTEFPFETPVDRSVALALLLTAALRPSLPTAPGFLLSKPSYGAGATFLAKLAGLIASGREPAVSPFSDFHEGRKQLNAALIAGRTVLILDNLPEGMPVSNPLLAQLTSETLLEVRELGTGRLHLIDCRRLVVGTGVGIYAGDDLTRRFLTCNLDPMLESPEARTFQRPALLAEVQRDRLAVLRDLYTVTAAYLAQPDRARVQALAGYAQWVRWVAEPLVWLGEPDVVETSRQAAASDNKTSLLQRLFPLLERLQAGRLNGVTVHDMMMHDDDKLGGGSWSERRELRQALHEVLGEATRARMYDDAPQLNPVYVARWLAGVAQRVVGGKRLVESGRLRGQPRWAVETVRRAPPVDPEAGP